MNPIADSDHQACRVRPAIVAGWNNELQAATVPTFYFIGVTTGGSSIMRVFPHWAKRLQLGPVAIQGIDCRLHDDPEVYRQVVQFLKHDPKSLGGLVTSHKLDLLDACRDLFDELDPHALQTNEVSCISKRNGKLIGHAKDPITAGLSLAALVPEDHFQRTESQLLILGAGGSSLALTSYLMQTVPPSRRPQRIVVSNRSSGRLEELERFHHTLGMPVPVDYHVAARAEDNDRLVQQLPSHSIVVNATGLGKDAPGSPLTDFARFPRFGFAWDFNYRGDLKFLRQAETQRVERSLTIEDGWVYFLHGWTRVIAEVFDVEIPTAGGLFEELSDLARQAR